MNEIEGAMKPYNEKNCDFRDGSTQGLMVYSIIRCLSYLIEERDESVKEDKNERKHGLGKREERDMTHRPRMIESIDKRNVIFFYLEIFYKNFL